MPRTAECRPAGVAGKALTAQQQAAVPPVALGDDSLEGLLALWRGRRLKQLLQPASTFGPGVAFTRPQPGRTTEPRMSRQQQGHTGAGAQGQYLTHWRPFLCRCTVDWSSPTALLSACRHAQQAQPWGGELDIASRLCCEPNRSLLVFAPFACNSRSLKAFVAAASRKNLERSRCSILAHPGGLPPVVYLLPLLDACTRADSAERAV